jgi:hypothetical protein
MATEEELIIMQRLANFIQGDDGELNKTLDDCDTIAKSYFRAIPNTETLSKIEIFKRGLAVGRMLETLGSWDVAVKYAKAMLEKAPQGKAEWRVD